ncbi:TPA: DUF1911 domain-containing protein [Vibrio cholerae]
MSKERTDFDLTRRDLLLEFDVYKEQSDYFKEDKNERYNKVRDLSNSLALRTRISWSISLGKFEYAILEYSAGGDILKVNSLIEDALLDLERHKNDFPSKVYLYWEPDSFNFLVLAFSFAVLSGNFNVLKVIVRMLGKNPQGKDDPILSILLARVGYIGLPRSEDLVFPRTYEHLYNSMKGDGVSPTKEERQESIKKYLLTWYKSMKDCYWFDRHKSRISNYFGYWAFETALVTVLYDLDDSSYRDMLYYPKDLVDHARNKGVDKLFHTQNIKQRWIVFPNDESPINGKWFDNLSNEVISTVKGERMPGVFENAQGYRHFWVSE